LSAPSTKAPSAWRLVYTFSLLYFWQIITLDPGDVVGDWCPFPPILGPLILGNLAPPEKVSTFPVRAKGQTIEVFIDRNLKERFESKYWAGILDAQGKATGEYY
jgi:hypothetical protein